MDGWDRDAARHFWFALGSVTLLAVASRQIGLSEPDGTVWDEVHFGKFGNHYINRSFYHDVHPPLGKMLIAGTFKLTGYNATFDFGVSRKYPDFFNYVAVRSMIAVLGALLVPMSFLIVWEVSASLGSAVMAGLCVLCDTFIHRLNTLILLDPFLLLAILTSVYGVYKFHNQSQREWSRAWWGWLTFTGVQLGLVMSIKYVGVFTVLYVGIHTAFQLFTIVTNKERPLWHVIPHTLARALCLIVVPVAVYFSTVVIHFMILTEGSPGSGGYYPTKFFMGLNNTEYDNTTFPPYIHYGANITVQNSRPMIGYLESWYDLFPREYSAPCQQVTTSTLKDPEALTWKIKKIDVGNGAFFNDEAPEVPPTLVRSGDFVVLTHVETGRSLRGHGYRAPITKRHFQVCGYGDNGTAGPFELWQVLIPGAEEGTLLEPFTMDFELKNEKMKCYLKGNEKVTLPKEWAFDGAKEVTCTRNVGTPGSLWHINWHNSPKPNISRMGSAIMKSDLQCISPCTLSCIRTSRDSLVLQGLEDSGIELEHKCSHLKVAANHIRQVMEEMDGFLQLFSIPLPCTVLAEHVVLMNLFFQSNILLSHPKKTLKHQSLLLSANLPDMSLPVNFHDLLVGDSEVQMSKCLYKHFGSCIIVDIVQFTDCVFLTYDTPLFVKRFFSGTPSGYRHSFPQIMNATLRPRDRAISTWERIVIGHEAMFIGNAILVPSEEDLERSARPWMWPILYRIQALCAYNKNSTTKEEVIAMGMSNPLITYLNVVTLVALIPLALAHSFLGSRHPDEDTRCIERRRCALESCGWLLLCWAMHYLPFFFMSRILYYHHYCPSYLFSCMITGVVVNFACETAAAYLPASRHPKDVLILLLPAAAISYSYFLLFPIATSYEGRLFKTHLTLNAVLEKFHFGQLWIELGFRNETLLIETSSMIDTFDPNYLDNPNINATLYYETYLRDRRVKNATITPVHASNYTLFTPLMPVNKTVKYVDLSLQYENFKTDEEEASYKSDKEEASDKTVKEETGHLSGPSTTFD
ncbi:protein O-mannosyl-transferase 2-like [Oratosquilla oratoria]|uniref:protein O-mannosyl-transferase 2-like n=1 Tax=Oratosquilla oratoria TaxID=337810 RepID=UPI003F75EA47